MHARDDQQKTDLTPFISFLLSQHSRTYRYTNGATDEIPHFFVGFFPALPLPPIRVNAFFCPADRSAMVINRCEGKKFLNELVHMLLQDHHRNVNAEE